MGNNSNAKAPYHAPVLTEHGTIRSLTKTDPTTDNPVDADGTGFYLS